MRQNNRRLQSSKPFNSFENSKMSRRSLLGFVSFTFSDGTTLAMTVLERGIIICGLGLVDRRKLEQSYEKHQPLV